MLHPRQARLVQAYLKAASGCQDAEMIAVVIFNLIKLSNLLVDLCCLIAVSSGKPGAVGIAVLCPESALGHSVSWWGGHGGLEIAFMWQHWTTVVLGWSHISW